MEVNVDGFVRLLNFFDVLYCASFYLITLRYPIMRSLKMDHLNTYLLRFLDGLFLRTACRPAHIVGWAICFSSNPEEIWLGCPQIVTTVWIRWKPLGGSLETLEISWSTARNTQHCCVFDSKCSSWFSYREQRKCSVNLFPFVSPNFQWLMSLLSNVSKWKWQCFLSVSIGSRCSYH